MPYADLWVAAVLNSPIAWWFSWRMAVHGKDEALASLRSLSRNSRFPSQRLNNEVGRRRPSVVSSGAEDQQATCRDLLDWLRVEYGIVKPSLKLQSPLGLDSDAFVAEVKKLRGKKNPLSAPALKSLREEYTRSIEPARARAAEALGLEQEISRLVNEAYGVTTEEVKLMWQTAPPRMPVNADHRT